MLNINGFEISHLESEEAMRNVIAMASMKTNQLRELIQVLHEHLYGYRLNAIYCWDHPDLIGWYHAHYRFDSETEKWIATESRMHVH